MFFVQLFFNILTIKKISTWWWEDVLGWPQRRYNLYGLSRFWFIKLSSLKLRCAYSKGRRNIFEQTAASFALALSSF